MGNLSGESREQNRKVKVTRFSSVTYARQLGLLVNTLGSHLKTLKGTLCEVYNYSNLDSQVLNQLFSCLKLLTRLCQSVSDTSPAFTHE